MSPRADQENGGDGGADDLARLDANPAFRALVERLGRGGEASAGELWGSSQALVLAALLQRVQGPWLVLVATDLEAEVVAADLETLGTRPLLFPAREEPGGRAAEADLDAIRDRLQVAQRLSGPPERRPRLLVASLLSMLQPIPSAAEIEGQFLHLAVNQRLVPEELLERLVATGYTRQPLAEAPGEVSLRGDILDVFPFAAELPLRIELFDDEVESLRTFEPEDQRSIESLPSVSICIASDAGGVEDGRGALPARILAPTTVFVSVEPLRILDQAEGLRIRSSSHARALAQLEEAAAGHPRLALQSLPSEDQNFGARSVQAPP